MNPILLLLFSFSLPLFAESVNEFVHRGMKNNLLFQEEKFGEKLSLHETKSANLSAILPKFSATVAFGPAPGIKEGIDTITVKGEKVAETYEKYDFTNLGSFFAGSIEMTQPLNFGRLITANKALDAQHKVNVHDIRGAEVKHNTDLQELYYGYQLARSSHELVKKVHKDFMKVLEDYEEKLEEDEISQFEFLEVQAGVYDVEDGLFQAEEGLKRAESNLHFFFPEQNPADIFGADTFIVKRKEKVPALEEFQSYARTHHPDLQRLKFGLEALKHSAEMKSLEMGPEFFLFGKIDYTKSWARSREDEGNSVFSQDPLNKLEGALGIGARLHLNFWAKNHKRVEARLKHKELKLKDNYASRGIDLKIAEAWLLVERHRKRLESVQISLEATEAWLQGKATQFDLDPSVAKELLKAYSKNASMKKNFYFVLYDYNLAVAKLIQKSGMTLSEYTEWSSKL